MELKHTPKIKSIKINNYWCTEMRYGASVLLHYFLSTIMQNNSNKVKRRKGFVHSVTQFLKRKPWFDTGAHKVSLKTVSNPII